MDLATIEVETGPQPQATVIWLHGLGANGSDFEPIVPDLRLDAEPAVRFVFPHAPFMPVTCNGGYVMRAWFDIHSLNDMSREVDEDGLLASRDTVRRLIARENGRGIPSQRTFLAGFSQGGAVAYLAALTHPEPLAGLIALSTYIPSPALISGEATEANRRIPIFAAHGSHDGVVPAKLGLRSRELLETLGYRPEWRTYAMDHFVCDTEIADIGAWLRGHLRALGDSA